MKTYLLAFIFTIIFQSTNAESVKLSEYRELLNEVSVVMGLSKEERLRLEKKSVVKKGHLPLTFDAFASRASGEISVSSTVTEERDVKSLIIHELVHLIYYEFKPQEENNFVLEGTALLIEFLYLKNHHGLNYAYKKFKNYLSLNLNTPELPIDNFVSNHKNYGSSFLFFLYLFENYFGLDFIQAHLRTSKNGLDGIQEALLMQKGFRMIPKSWKSKDVIVGSYYWSFLNKRNMLSLHSSDSFTTILKENNSSLPTVSIDSINFHDRALEVRPYSAQLLMIDKISSCKLVDSKLSFYEITGSVGSYKKNFISNIENFDFSDNTILVINTTNTARVINFDCIHLSNIK